MTENKRLGAVLLFCLPVLYLGIILSVSLHEVAGHGLAAAAVGGRFKGFCIYPDGMGWADVDVFGLGDPQKAVVLSAGVLCTTAASIVLFALGAALKGRFHAELALLMLSVACLMDGQPYFFWDAVFQSGVGDFSVISTMYPSVLLRICVAAACGLMTAAGTAFFTARFFALVSRRAGCGEPTRKTRIAASLLALVLQAAGWFTFGWDELVPGVGLLPGISAMGIALVTLLVLNLRSGRFKPGIHAEAVTRFGAPMIIAWAAALGTALCTAVWLAKGAVF